MARCQPRRQPKGLSPGNQRQSPRKLILHQIASPPGRSRSDGCHHARLRPVAETTAWPRGVPRNLRPCRSLSGSLHTPERSTIRLLECVPTVAAGLSPAAEVEPSLVWPLRPSPPAATESDPSATLWADAAQALGRPSAAEGRLACRLARLQCRCRPATKTPSSVHSLARRCIVGLQEGLGSGSEREASLYGFLQEARP